MRKTRVLFSVPTHSPSSFASTGRKQNGWEFRRTCIMIFTRPSSATAPASDAKTMHNRLRLWKYDEADPAAPVWQNKLKKINFHY